jgi:hypothetical protein
MARLLDHQQRPAFTRIGDLPTRKSPCCPS